MWRPLKSLSLWSGAFFFYLNLWSFVILPLLVCAQCCFDLIVTYALCVACAQTHLTASAKDVELLINNKFSFWNDLICCSFCSTNILTHYNICMPQDNVNIFFSPIFLKATKLSKFMYIYFANANIISFELNCKSATYWSIEWLKNYNFNQLLSIISFTHLLLF